MLCLHVNNLQLRYTIKYNSALYSQTAVIYQTNSNFVSRKFSEQRYKSVYRPDNHEGRSSNIIKLILYILSTHWRYEWAPAKLVSIRDLNARKRAYGDVLTPSTEIYERWILIWTVLLLLFHVLRSIRTVLAPCGITLNRPERR